MQNFLLIFGILALLGCSRHENIQELGEHCQNIQNSPEDYQELCDCYASNNYSFPNSNVKEYVLYNNLATEHGEVYQKIASGSDSLILNGFRTLVSDSSNFRWGEIGTPWTHYKLDFIDSKNHVIARIKVDVDGGMLWTTPNFDTTKWGLLSGEGFQKIMHLLKLIADS